MDTTAEINEHNIDLLSKLTLAEQALYPQYFVICRLLILCLFLFAINSYISRLCQHHNNQLHGIRTDGALVVIPQPAEAFSKTSSKAFLLLGSILPVELLSPTYTELFARHLSELPLLAEAVLFLLICAVIRKLSSDLGKGHSKRALAYSS